jgi:hypothetical protein
VVSLFPGDLWKIFTCAKGGAEAIFVEEPGVVVRDPAGIAEPSCRGEARGTIDIVEPFG